MAPAARRPMRAPTATPGPRRSRSCAYCRNGSGPARFAGRGRFSLYFLTLLRDGVGEGDGGPLGDLGPGRRGLSGDLSLIACAAVACVLRHQARCPDPGLGRAKVGAADLVGDDNGR